MSQDYQDILYRVEDPVAIITMNRPEAMNAFTTRMLAEIRHASAAAERQAGLLRRRRHHGRCITTCRPAG